MLYCSSAQMSPFACLWGWGSNSYHYSSIAHLKKIALPLTPTSNFASQPETNITGTERVQRLTYSYSFRWCAQLNCIMLSPKSLREVIVKHDLILSVISLCQKVILIFEKHLKPAQKIVMKLNFSSPVVLTHTLSLSKDTQGHKNNWKAKVEPLKIFEANQLGPQCEAVSLINTL